MCPAAICLGDTWAWLDAQLGDALLRDPTADHAAQIAGGRTRLAEPGAPRASADELHRHERRAMLTERATQIYIFAVVFATVAKRRDVAATSPCRVQLRSRPVPPSPYRMPNNSLCD
jgi:hypothetical protein